MTYLLHDGVIVLVTAAVVIAFGCLIGLMLSGYGDRG